MNETAAVAVAEKHYTRRDHIIVDPEGGVADHKTINAAKRASRALQKSGLTVKVEPTKKVHEGFNRLIKHSKPRRVAKNHGPMTTYKPPKENLPPRAAARYASAFKED